VDAGAACGERDRAEKKRSGTEWRKSGAGQSGEKAEWVCVGVRDTFFKVNDERIKTVR
jgi:hypothetical protein